MTRVLVVAPYPPSTDPLAATALAYVRALRAAGHVVDVWSPEPSAARYHGRLTAPAGLLTLARVTRGCDRVRVYFRADCHPAPPAAAQGMLRVALRAALGPVPRVEVVPCGPDAAASPTFVMFVAAGADVVQPDRTEDAPVARRPDEWPAVSGPHDIGVLQGVVRTRAAAARRQRDDRLARVDAAPLDPLRLAVPPSATPGVAALRRVVQRLTAWETEPILTRLNRLSALIERDRRGSPS